MRLDLVLDPTLIKRHYGDVPDTYGAPEKAFESWRPGFDADDYRELFDFDFIEPVNALCHSLIDRGDVDYLDAKQCGQLALWLDNRMSHSCPYPLDEFYAKLFEFSSRAAALGTGVVLDL